MKDNILFIISHPLNALRARIRQIEVGIEYSAPPAGETIEGFPELTVQNAAKAMGLVGKCGIGISDWPATAQDDMKRGKRICPDGRHPEHLNI